MIKENNDKIEIYKIKDTKELKKALVLFLAAFLFSILMIFLLSNLFLKIFWLILAIISLVILIISFRIFKKTPDKTLSIVISKSYIELYMKKGIQKILMKDIQEVSCIEKSQLNEASIKYKDENGKTVWEVREMPKTEAGDRFVYVTDKVMETIHQLRLLPHETDYIFEVNGHWMQSFYYDRALRRICKALHIPVRSLHKLRRTYGTTLINSHLEDSLVTSQMGHTSIDTTKKYYYYDNIEDDYKKDLIMQAVSF